jgi:hypothetical protein
VSVPVELLRAGVSFHARGLLNTKAIQTNRDWIWPYWVEQQFDPRSPSFLPRAFSATHVNLTHRNWTAIGFPGCAAFPVVDPRGLLTPFFDGWSIDIWLTDGSGAWLLPSRCKHMQQRQGVENDRLVVTSDFSQDGMGLRLRAWSEMETENPTCVMEIAPTGAGSGSVVVALRPFNPEGVSLVNRIELAESRKAWFVDGADCVDLSRPATQHAVANYRDGDVFRDLLERPEESVSDCPAGLAMAAAIYDAKDLQNEPLQVRISLTQDPEPVSIGTSCTRSWPEAIAPAARLQLSDSRYVNLYNRAVETLLLLSPGDVVPGPYTYKRFWFRDAVVMMHAMLLAGLFEPVRRAIDRFPPRQNRTGYFRSQEGEWDSNGQVLWLLRRYVECTGEDLDPDWHRRATNAADWIIRKRCSKDDSLHAGLLPAGFSAEHLGNNDYYLWDDYWSEAGLRAAGWFCNRWGDDKRARQYVEEANDLRQCIEQSLDRSQERREHPGLPASTYRRMDAGAVGSLVVGYPLQLCGEQDKRLLETVGYLREHCCIDNAFFQDMIHSGLNAYLTLYLAQCLLRADDGRCHAMIDAVAGMASSTGHWPEAVHPQTGGGCMGDGQHGWAAAEWILMMRNLFVREESDRLVLASGIRRDWITGIEPLSFGPTPTRWGPLSVKIEPHDDDVILRWHGNGRDSLPRIEVRLPCGKPRFVENPESSGEIRLPRNRT